MPVSMRVSDDCRRLALNIRVVRGRGRLEVFRPLVGAVGRNVFDRLMIAQDGRKAKRRQWPEDCVNILAQIVEQLTGFDAVEVREHLLYPELGGNPALAELIRGKTFRINS